MIHQTPIINRAFELARSGECKGIVDIRRQLRAEGYRFIEIDAHLDGLSVSRQLLAICQAANDAQPKSD